MRFSRSRLAAGVVVRQMGRTIAAPDDLSVEARIGAHIHPLPSGCWQWKDGAGEAQYVKLTIHGKKVGLHRWIYFTVHGELDERDWVDHVLHHECENKRCLNPAHMSLLTQGDHMARHAEIRKAQSTNVDSAPLGGSRWPA